MIIEVKKKVTHRISNTNEFIVLESYFNLMNKTNLSDRL